MDASSLVNAEQIQEHLSMLFSESCEDLGLYFNIFCLPAKKSRYFGAVTDEAVRYCADAASSGQNVYASMSCVREIPQPTEDRPEPRVSNDEAQSISCFWADVDVLDPKAHKGKKYPTNVDEALDVCNVGGLKPTCHVLSGYGVHAYWFLNEPFEFETDQDHADATIFVKRWLATVKHRAKSMGFYVDSTFDLARVLRVAGTLNWKNKRKPRPVVLNITQGKAATRFAIDDLECRMIAPEYVDGAGSTTPMAEVSDFTIDPNVQIDSRIIKAVTGNDQKIKQTWQMARQDLDDQSPSGYEMALANFMVRMDWDDQQIVDILTYWRREVAKKPKIRVDYYQRTLGRARAGVESEKAYEEIVSGESEVPVGVQSKDLTSGDKRKFLLGLRSVIGVAIVRFKQQKVDEAEYFIELENGDEFSVGRIQDVTRFGTFRDRILERCGVSIAPERVKDWAKVTQYLMAIREVIEVDEPRTQDRMINLLGMYFDQVNVYPEEEWTRALREKQPFVLEGRAWVHKMSVSTWARSNLGLRLDRAEIERDFHLLHMERRRMFGSDARGRQHRLWYWGAPIDDFSHVAPSLSTKTPGKPSPIPRSDQEDAEGVSDG